MAFKCKNPECGKVFLIPGQLTIEKDTREFGVKRRMLEVRCCPFCECLEFEEVKR